MNVNYQYPQSLSHNPFRTMHSMTSGAPMSLASPLAHNPMDSSFLSPLASLLSLFGAGGALNSICFPQSQMPMSMGSPNFGGQAPSAGFQSGRDLSSLGPSTYDNIIQEAAAQHNLDPALIKAVIKKESSFNPNAGSGKGARGLMQLMPATARAMGCQNPTDPRQNIFAGAKYLSQMLRQHNGNVELALAAYNAGPGNVRKHGGIPPFRETQDYVRVITADLQSVGGMRTAQV